MRINRRKSRRVLPLIGALTLAATLTACGSSGATGSASQTDANPPANGSATGSPAHQSAAELYAQAKREGSLTFYTTIAGDDVAKVVGAFNKTYPGIKVDATRMSADKLLSRVLTEQKGGKFGVDVISDDSPQMAQMIHAKALQPYDAPDNAPLPGGLTLPSGYQNVIYVLTTAIAWNPTVLKQKGLTAPTSWKDLTKPEWKGEFSVDPKVNWYDSLVVSMGHDKALQLIKDLAKNSPRLVDGHTLALTQVAAGDPAGSAIIYGYKAASIRKGNPAAMAFVNPNPLPASLNLIDVAKQAPHPAAAKLFVDWVVSKEGQQAIVDTTGQSSIRDDVVNNPLVWDPKKWTPAWGASDMTAETYNKYLQELKQVFNLP